MTPKIACANCKRFRGKPATWPTCEAFPDGIPEEIAYGENQHREPFPGDHGFQWEAKDEKA